MSEADEIIKLKELLDEKMITQEEFEKKKKELLGNSTKTEYKEYKKKKTLSPIVVFFIIIFIFYLVFSFMMSLAKNSISIEGVLKNKYGLSGEQAKNITSKLEECDITGGVLSEAPQFNNTYIENGKAYIINMETKKCKALMILDENSNLYLVRIIEISNTQLSEEATTNLFENGSSVLKLDRYLQLMDMVMQAETTN